MEAIALSTAEVEEIDAIFPIGSAVGGRYPQFLMDTTNR
jgi:hypothetical protein